MRDATSEELFAHLVLERGQLAPSESRTTERTVDDAARAELLGRRDATSAIASVVARGRGESGAVGRSRHVVACGMAAEMLLSLGSESAMFALFDLVAGEETEALASVHRVVRAHRSVTALVDPRCEARTLRVALLSFERVDAGRPPDFEARLRNVAGIPGVADVVDRLLAFGDHASRALLLRRALEDPRSGGSAVDALVATFALSRVDDLRAVVRRAPDGWSIVESVLGQLGDESECLDVAFSYGDGALWWASPERMLDAVAEWFALADDDLPRQSGLTPLYGVRFGRAVVRGPCGVALRRAQTQTMRLGGADLYTIACSHWHAEGAMHRVHRLLGVPAEPTTELDARLDPDWARRNERALSDLTPGRYAAALLVVDFCQTNQAPFSKAAAEVYEDEEEVDQPTPVPHFAALPIMTAQGPTEIVLLPSGLRTTAAPVAYVWRAPEELAYAAHPAQGEAPRQTRIVGVLLQGEASLQSAGDTPVLFVWPSAWAGDDERIAAALAPVTAAGPVSHVVGVPATAASTRRSTDLPGPYRGK